MRSSPAVPSPSPTSSGTRTGTLTVVDSLGTQVATLTGLATNPATDSLTPLALSFTAQQLGTISPSQQLTLTNAGDVALTLISTQIIAIDFASVSSCGNSLAVHPTCAITGTYSPKAIGAQTGTVSVADQFRTQTVALSGIGLAPPSVSLSPSNGLAFDATGVGVTATSQTVTLTNNGGVPLTLSGTAHSICTVNPGTTALGGTTNISVTVATGLSTAAVHPSSLPWTRNLIWLALLLPLGFVRRRHRSLWPALLLLVALSGCSTGRLIPSSTTPGTTVFTTPSGTYTLVVAGSSAGIVHAVNLTLVIQ